MKIITLITLLAAFAFSTNALAQDVKKVTEGLFRKQANNAVTITPKKITAKLVKVIKKKADVPEGFSKVTLVAGDIWGDGSGYQMLLDADHTAYGTVIPANGAFTTSGDASNEDYAQFEYKIPENADGACSTSNIIVNSSGSVTIPAGIYDFCITNPTPNDRIWIASNGGNIPGRVDDYEFASMCEYIFTLSEHESNDCVNLTIIDPNAATIPTNVTIQPGAVTAEVKWRSTESMWNLRYRPYVPLSQIIYDLNMEDYEAQIANWLLVDNDNDGKGWGLAFSSSAQDDLCFYSASWDADAGTLTPDNWLISAPVPLGGSFTFKAWPSDPGYPENLSVYVLEGEELTSIADFIPLQENIAINSETTHEFDLSEYSGTGLLAFRHHNVTDMFRLVIDDIIINDPNGGVIPDWTYVYGVTENPHTISGLQPDTEYEVQVQSERTDNGRISDWTESVRFFTLDATGINGLIKDKKTGDKVFYNIAGQRVSGNLPAGIYINNGKKVVVK